MVIMYHIHLMLTKYILGTACSQTSIVEMVWYHYLQLQLIIDLHIHIKYCRFIDINSTAIIRTFVHKAEALSVQSLVAIIHNTSFAMLENAISVLLIENTLLILGGPVVFTKIVDHVTIVHLVVNSYIIISDHLAFSFNRACYCIIMHVIFYWANRASQAWHHCKQLFSSVLCS